MEVEVEVDNADPINFELRSPAFLERLNAEPDCENLSRNATASRDSSLSVSIQRGADTLQTAGVNDRSVSSSSPKDRPILTDWIPAAARTLLWWWSRRVKALDKREEGSHNKDGEGEYAKKDEEDEEDEKDFANAWRSVSVVKDRSESRRLDEKLFTEPRGSPDKPPPPLLISLPLPPRSLSQAPRLDGAAPDRPAPAPAPARAPAPPLSGRGPPHNGFVFREMRAGTDGQRTAACRSTVRSTMLVCRSADGSATKNPIVVSALAGSVMIEGKHSMNVSGKLWWKNGHSVVYTFTGRPPDTPATAALLGAPDDKTDEEDEEKDDEEDEDKEGEEEEERDEEEGDEEEDPPILVASATGSFEMEGGSMTTGSKRQSPVAPAIADEEDKEDDNEEDGDKEDKDEDEDKDAEEDGADCPPRKSADVAVLGGLIWRFTAVMCLCRLFSKAISSSCPTSNASFCGEGRMRTCRSIACRMSSSSSSSWVDSSVNDAHAGTAAAEGNVSVTEGEGTGPAAAREDEEEVGDDDADDAASCFFCCASWCSYPPWSSFRSA